MLAEELSMVVWLCIHFVEAQKGGQVITGIPSSTLKVLEVDGSSLRTEQDLFSAVAGAMRFPDYFGMNWDALDECLRDMSWLPADGYVLLFRGAEHFLKEAPRLGGSFIESWLFSAEHWAREGKPFHLVFVW